MLSEHQKQVIQQVLPSHRTIKQEKTHLFVDPTQSWLREVGAHRNMSVSSSVQQISALQLLDSSHPQSLLVAHDDGNDVQSLYPLELDPAHHTQVHELEQ